MWLDSCICMYMYIIVYFLIATHARSCSDKVTYFLIIISTSFHWNLFVTNLQTDVMGGSCNMELMLSEGIADIGSGISPLIRMPWNEDTSIIRTPWNQDTSIIRTPWNEDTSIIRTPWNQDTSIIRTPWNQDTSIIRTPWNQDTSIIGHVWLSHADTLSVYITIPEIWTPV